ncbi:MAG: hypothetical protein ACOC7O_02905 [Thermoplasmatota archaeon]
MTDKKTDEIEDKLDLLKAIDQENYTGDSKEEFEKTDSIYQELKKTPCRDGPTPLDRDILMSAVIQILRPDWSEEEYMEFHEKIKDRTKFVMYKSLCLSKIMNKRE